MDAPLGDSTADRGTLLDAWVQTREQIARLEARAADLLAARAAMFDDDARAHPRHRDMARRSMVAEYAAAGRIGGGTVTMAFGDAEALVAHFPGLHAALREGTVSASHVHAIIAAADPTRDAVRNGRLPEEAFATYETACLTIAEQDSPARTRTHARLIAATLAGASLTERYERAASERNVRVRALDEGMAELIVVLPQFYAVAIKDRLSRLAGAIALSGRSPREQELGIAFTDPAADLDDDDAAEDATASDLDPADPRRRLRETIASGSTYAVDPDHDPEARVEFIAPDGRTRRQIETDALVDLLLAGRPSAALGTGLENITASVQVTIRATTLAGEDDRLAELDGQGPLHPGLARELARFASGWNRLALDDQGVITRVDRYTPTEAMKRHLRARDQRCRFPGCHTPAARCQIDHNRDHALGGPTAIDNLACFCPGHHPLKHPDLDDEDRWTARQSPDGAVEWRSPLGRTYADPPPRRVLFV
jgi:hypothetical protein